MTANLDHVPAKPAEPKPKRQRRPKDRLVATMLESVTRWQVTSASRPGMLHTVDLTSFWNFGECSCERFEFTMRPLLVRGTVPEVRCSHILAARNAYADATLGMLAGKMPNIQSNGASVRSDGGSEAGDGSR